MKYFFCILATGITIFSITTSLQAQTIPIGNRQPPPLPSTKEGIDEWKRRYCSIGWREYGMAHIERCLELTRINPEDVKPSATLSSPPARRSVNFPRPPILPERKCDTTKLKSPGPGWIPQPGFNQNEEWMTFVKPFPKKGQRSGYTFIKINQCSKHQSLPSTFAVNCADWDVYNLGSNNGTWEPILPGTWHDRWAEMACKRNSKK